MLNVKHHGWVESNWASWTVCCREECTCCSWWTTTAPASAFSSSPLSNASLSAGFTVNSHMMPARKHLLSYIKSSLIGVTRAGESGSRNLHRVEQRFFFGASFWYQIHERLSITPIILGGAYRQPCDLRQTQQRSYADSRVGHLSLWVWHACKNNHQNWKINYTLYNLRWYCLYIGASKMAEHISFMTGYYPNRWLQFCWKFISPLLIVVHHHKFLAYIIYFRLLIHF